MSVSRHNFTEGQAHTLVHMKDSHTRVQCEEQAHTSVHEGRHTHVPVKDRCTQMCAHKGKAHTRTYEGQAHMCTYEGQPHTCTHKGQVYTCTHEGQAHTCTRKGQAHAHAHIVAAAFLR